MRFEEERRLEEQRAQVRYGTAVCQRRCAVRACVFA